MPKLTDVSFRVDQVALQPVEQQISKRAISSIFSVATGCRDSRQKSPNKPLSLCSAKHKQPFRTQFHWSGMFESPLTLLPLQRVSGCNKLAQRQFRHGESYSS